VGAAVDDDVLRRDAQTVGADPRDDVRRTAHRSEVRRRRLALDELAQVAQEQGQVHQSTLGVARTP